MQVSGYKTERELLKYINVTKRETAINLSYQTLFMGNPLRALARNTAASGIQILLPRQKKP